MKWLIVLLCLVCFNVFAQDEFDITEKVIPNINKGSIEQIVISPLSKQASVIVRIGHLENNDFVQDKLERIIFRDIEDNPITIENEGLKDYTNFITTIKLNETVLRNLIQSKLNE